MLECFLVCFSPLAREANEAIPIFGLRLASGLSDTEDGQEVAETETKPGLESTNFPISRPRPPSNPSNAGGKAAGSAKGQDKR